MSNPRKHHYVPVFYLRQWVSTDRQLCEYKRVAGRIVRRRTFPDGTGYQKDLYRIDGLPDDVAQVVEQGFMRMVDTEASQALQKMVQGGQPGTFTARQRSAWARFLLSLWFRNPEAVAVLKRQMIALSEAILQNMRNTYKLVPFEGDPPTFEEYVARVDRDMPQKAAMQLLQEVIDSTSMGPLIFGMQWSRVSLAASRVTLLTSDRPLDMPHGLGSDEAYIALPVGPKTLFVADHNGVSAHRLRSIDPTKIVRDVNMAVVHQARQFVWGLDDSQLRFVQNRMSKAPDRPIITDEQRQRAIDSALAGEPVSGS